MTNGVTAMDKRDELVRQARTAMAQAYAPYSRFHVGAALLFEDGTVVSGANVENASYGLALCAETVAVSAAMAAGRRGGLVAVAVIGGIEGEPRDTITPCGRCRQVLNELAQLGETDPVIWCAGGEAVMETRLSALLPHAFGPANLAP
jgi:cytidine deaminase